jgi:hypothetical protein
MKYLPWLTLLTLLAPVAGAVAASPESVTFEKHVRPILKAYCFDCHGEGEKLRGRLDLRLRRLIVQGGSSGAAVEPGKPADSLLYQKVAEGAMPPGKKKLSREEVALLGRWIADGARSPGPSRISSPPGPTSRTRTAPSGPSSLSAVRRCPPPGDVTSSAPPSTPSCSPGWRPRG